MSKKLQKGLTTAIAVTMGASVFVPAVTVIAATTTTGWVKNGRSMELFKKWCKINRLGKRRRGMVLLKYKRNNANRMDYYFLN